MVKKGSNQNQIDFIFDNLDDVKISHKKNFRIEVPYILFLSRYNDFLKTEWDTDLENDNLLLRKMYAGIQNSMGTPPEIFDGLNSIEICLMEVGIFKRKYVYLEDLVVKQGKSIHTEPRRVKIDLESYAYESRIKKDGHLSGKNLYEIVEYLLTASGVSRIYKRYQKNWKKLFESDKISKERTRSKRLNPYDPSTLRARMLYIQREYPNEFYKFKEVLAKPFIPQRIVLPTKAYGDRPEIKNPEGFIIPGKIHREGMLYHNLKAYANWIHTYFESKERGLKKK